MIMIYGIILIMGIVLICEVYLRVYIQGFGTDLAGLLLGPREHIFFIIIVRPVHIHTIMCTPHGLLLGVLRAGFWLLFPLKKA